MKREEAFEFKIKYEGIKSLFDGLTEGDTYDHFNQYLKNNEVKYKNCLKELKRPLWQRNIFHRTYREKKAWNQMERISCQTAPAMVIRPRKFSYFRMFLTNLRRAFNGDQDFIPTTWLGKLIWG